MEKVERWLDREEASLASEAVAVGAVGAQQRWVKVDERNKLVRKLPGLGSSSLLSSYHQS